MSRNESTRRIAIVLSCVAIGVAATACGGDDEGGGGQQQDGGAGDDAAVAAIDCTGANAETGQAPAMSTCGIASCHNADFAGQRGGSGFASSNLTPDDTGLAEWTTGEIAKATLDGVTPEGEVLCPIMIRYRTTGMTEAQACDIAEYLRSLAPIENEVEDTCE
ncbi:c-type cytochrome [Sandaracinus amylolyticus]|uniref:c-type cytochrome n=1 Tax=Sandaracinus amylolyticus TaxID=927083 RepID=UPI00069E080F|nr:hypothetical protein [Sandaracinus amylolyticus]